MAVLMRPGITDVERHAVAGAAERVYGTVPHQDSVERPRIEAARSGGGLAKVRSSMAGRSPWLRPGVLLALLLVCSGCDTVSSVTSSMLGTNGPAEGQPGYVQGFLGGAVSDEPRATLVAREVLSAGGSAADAAVALGFALAVTLPSRAGLGGGGACVAYAADKKSVNNGVPEAVIFTPIASASSGGDRPAAVPMLPRGLYLLHARYGRRPFESLMVPAEQLARFGTPASRALVRDLALVSGPLFADPNTRAVFSKDGAPIVEGQQLLQSDLGATLAQIRVSGVGDFYTGALARRIEQASPLAGGPIALADLRGALPRMVPAIVLSDRNDKVAFLPPPADGGVAAAAGFMTLQRNASAYTEAAARALAVSARWRAGGVDAQSLLSASDLQEAPLPSLPASTGFATLDNDGNAVACVLSMDNLFGTGRILPRLGFLLAASPAVVPPPLYAAAIAWNENTHAFRAAAVGSGQEGAPVAAAAGMLNALHANRPMAATVPDPGRVSVIECSRYLPGDNGSCAWASDPRDAGLAVGGG
jgi:gamma-glutamyltranspeptidase/glutathione hydrolase